MKIIAKIFLILFIVFLILPTIVTLIEKSSGISAWYSTSKLEHFDKEIETFIYFDHFLKNKILIELLSNDIS